MTRTTRALLTFLLVVGIVAVTLRLLRDLPVADGDAIRPYPSIEEVRRHFHREVVVLPAYFPKGISWPPDEIYAGREPDFACVMHFHETSTNDLVLSISQADEAETRLPARLVPTRVLRTETIILKRGDAVLNLALCADERPCNQVTLERHGRSVSVIGRYPSEELVKIANSLR